MHTRPRLARRTDPQNSIWYVSHQDYKNEKKSEEKRSPEVSISMVYGPCSGSGGLGASPKRPLQGWNGPGICVKSRLISCDVRGPFTMLVKLSKDSK